MPVNVLFFCLGNICRSPTAEGVFTQAVARAGLSGQIKANSAGTGRWHIRREASQGLLQHIQQRLSLS